ncbi:MAG: Cas10/Cmr2 second palm domain-containing protein, partial [Raineya sp.]
MQYLLKIDISGIQTFIFDVPSKGASRQLKARSVYVQMLTFLAEEFFKNALGKIEVLYNGGGNLFFFVESQEEQIQESIRKFQQDFTTENIFPIVAYVPKNEDFKVTMQALAQKANIAKLQKPLYLHSYDYKPVKEGKWKEITENLIEATGFIIKAEEKHTTAHPLSKAGLVLEFSKVGLQFEGTILNKVPISKDESITEFDEIAQKATGDAKLAALKMDVDNLGQLFRNKNQDEYQRNSKVLSEFFEKKIYEILKEYIKNEYIYPIFSGGDDCFLIGAWDKILEVAGKIQVSFDKYQKENNLHLTLSAGVV